MSTQDLQYVSFLPSSIPLLSHWSAVPLILCDTRARFEKSLYDLIRGLRNHKGSEREYIQHSLKECRAEVKSQDMGK